MTGFTVVRDTRERSENGWYFYPTDKCEGTVRLKLDVGDYSLLGYENDLFIERKKSLTEVAKNIVEKRFWRELDRMKELSPTYRYIIMEFPEEDILQYPYLPYISQNVKQNTRISGKFIMSMLYKMREEYGITILFFPERVKAENFLLSLFEVVTSS